MQEPQVECLGDEGGLIFDEEISSPVEIPKPKILAPILQIPLVILEANKSVFKTVADVKPAEAKLENTVPASEPQKPITVCLDAPSPGDGVSGVAFRRVGYLRGSETGLEMFNKQCEALNQFHKKNLQRGLQ